MRICILSRNPTLYSTRRLRDAALARGHKVMVVDYLRCYVDITARSPKVMYTGAALQKFDAIIPRVASSAEAAYGAAIVRQFEMIGSYSLNASQAIVRSGDKLRSLQLLSRQNVDLPRTSFAHATLSKDDLIDLVGPPPLVIKLLQGSQGAGVVLAPTRKAAEAVISAFQQLNANFLVQEFIAEAEGRDIRAFVVGGKVVAAMERSAPPGDFRSNLHRGGTAQAIKLTKREERVAISAAKAMNLNVAGVDLIRAKRGPLVLEVNSSPGLEGIETATKVDVAGQIIEYIEKKVTENESQDPQRKKVDA
ncbi:MAG: 30S ribosomal protein S6--L-glutamate ligase [Planctomycetota bacterium]|nr:30S ribosomal protein S6--L-glutamate ligase [Planctomycetota bacterium]